MPSLNKKDYTDHISAFFAKQGKRMTNLSKMSIERLEAIIIKHKIPDLNEDEIFQARIDKRREQSEARKKKKNANIEGTDEYKEKKEEEEKERLEGEERDRQEKVRDMMIGIIRTKLIRDFYNNNTHEERINKWKAYINRNNIMNWSRFQNDYDTAIGIIGKDEITKTWTLEFNKFEEGGVNINNGMNVMINSNMLRDKVYEPYMRIKIGENEINPFK